MEQKYWDDFISTGSVEDYLYYRRWIIESACYEFPAKNWKSQIGVQMGVQSSESNCVNGNGAVNGTDWGI